MTQSGVLTKKYDRFRGVDFSTDPEMIDQTRSPFCQNLISDAGGFPEKRPGWETTKAYADGGTVLRINGMHVLVDGSGTRHFLVHAGTRLYKEANGESGGVDFDGTATVLCATMANARSSAFCFDNKAYILDGENFKVFDGTALCDVEDVAFEPTTTIGAPPSGGGTAFEAVNLIGRYRKNSFSGDGVSTTFHLDVPCFDDEKPTAFVDGAEVTALVYDKDAGTVTFAAALPDGNGVDNVVIRFSRTVAGNADLIKKCRFAMWYGAGAFSRVFVSGNPEHRNRDWHSGLYDPTYYPDNGYTDLGSSASAVMGYLRQYDNMLIIKEDNSQDATMFVRTAELDGGGNAVFPVRQGIAGVGAISMHSFATLRDDPLFLSGQGVFSPAMAYGGVNSQRAMQNRSFFVDARLTKEPNLGEAVAAVWNGYYILGVNGRCYVADSRQRSGNDGGTGYEWYHWTNVSARCFLAFGDQLYFGREDVSLCRFRTDAPFSDRYCDDEAPIDAFWATKEDHDGDFMRVKTMRRRGSGVMVKPYSKTSVTVYVKTESGAHDEAGSQSAVVFDFANLSFEHFSFCTDSAAVVMPMATPVKGYRSLQLIARNNVAGEGFGVYGFIKRYRFMRYVRE